MSANVATLYLIIAVVMLLPLLLLGVEWYNYFSTRPKIKAIRFWLLSLVSVSYAWLLSGWKFPSALGRYYSSGRYAIIDGNFLAILFCLILAFRSDGAGKKVFIATCILIAALWSFMAAVNSVV